MLLLVLLGDVVAALSGFLAAPPASRQKEALGG